MMRSNGESDDGGRVRGYDDRTSLYFVFAYLYNCVDSIAHLLSVCRLTLVVLVKLWSMIAVRRARRTECGSALRCPVVSLQRWEYSSSTVSQQRMYIHCPLSRIDLRCLQLCTEMLRQGPCRRDDATRRDALTNKRR